MIGDKYDFDFSREVECIYKGSDTPFVTMGRYYAIPLLVKGRVRVTINGLLANRIDNLAIWGLPRSRFIG